MSQDPIDYQQLMHAALRDVVRRALEVVARQGLPDGHFFYITFLTRAPGVELAPELIQRYPDEMTIILQQQFWDLEVTRETFSVGLSFSQLHYSLTVPFSAVVSFVDPPAEFGLRFAPPPGFETPDEMRVEDTTDAEEEVEALAASSGGKVVSFDAFRKKQPVS